MFQMEKFLEEDKRREVLRMKVWVGILRKFAPKTESRVKHLIDPHVFTFIMVNSSTNSGFL